MAPSQVTAAIVTGSASSRSYPVANATAAGDTLTALAIVNNTAGTVSALADSQGNVYTLDDSFISAQPMVYAFRCPGATGGPGGTPSKALSTADTFTLTTAAVSANIQLYVTDAGPVGALDNIPAIATGASTTPSVSATPATNGDTAVPMFGTAFSGGAPTVNAPFTGLGSFNTGSNPYGTAAYDQLAGGSGTPQTSTLTIVSANWRGIMWLFQPGAGGVTGTGALAGAGQTLAGSGAAGVSGTGGLAGAGQALAGSGTVTPPPVTGAGGLAGTGQALAGAGAITPRQLLLALAPAAGTDEYGNTYPAGVTLFGLPLQTMAGGVVTTQMTPAGDFAVLNSHGKTIGLLAAGNGGGGGLFSYADQGATQGALIGSVASAAGTDAITGAAYSQGVSVGQAGSQQVQLLLQLIGGLLSGLLTFPSGQSWEEPPSANVSAGVGGTSPAQYIEMLLTGPATNTVGARDRVLAAFNSAAQDNSSNANLELIYEGSNGNLHLYAYLDPNGLTIVAGTIVAPHPGTVPVTPETWQPLALNAGWSAGQNNGFTDPPMVRMLADNKMLMFKGTLACPASGPVTSTPFASLPAGYPGANFGGPYGRGIVTTLSGAHTGFVQAQNNGGLSLFGAFANGDAVVLSCIVPTQ